jgi:branched-chain amino acid transport system ATP-binding protein
MATEVRPAGPILETRGATARFGAFTAVDGASYQLQAGETAGIIGPNGAGKSTFFNLMTGMVSPSAGTIHLDGADVTRVQPHGRVKRGLVRTFQLVSVFDALPVQDNLVLAVIHADPSLASGPGFLLGGAHGGGLEAAARAALDRVGLAGKARWLTAELSYGEKRKLEIGMALALRPRVLLLDEPFAGLSDFEIGEVMRLVKAIQGSLAMVIIEHKISHLVDMVTRLSVMHEGRIIADGKPAQVLEDPTVRQVYWGGGAGRGLAQGRGTKKAEA